MRPYDIRQRRHQRHATAVLLGFEFYRILRIGTRPERCEQRWQVQFRGAKMRGPLFPRRCLAVEYALVLAEVRIGRTLVGGHDATK